MSAALPPETREIPTDSAGPRSRALFERAKAVIPGGVNSPVRAYRAVGGTPLFLAKGDGAYFEDADGRRYLDFVCSWGPLILGHAHPAITAAVALHEREDDVPVGRVLHAVPAPGLGLRIGLGYLPKDFQAIGTELALPDGTAVTVAGFQPLPA